MMQSCGGKVAFPIFFALLCIGYAGYGSSEPDQAATYSIEVEKPLAATADENLEVDLIWVIVRNGPGSWAEDADWDEYIFRFTNRSDSSLRLATVYLHDSLDTALQTNGRRRELIKQSKQSVKRYDREGLRVKAGMGGDALTAAGSAVYLAGAATGVAVLTSSIAATGVATAAAVSAVVVAPILIIGGVVRGYGNAEIAASINERQAKLPESLAPGETQILHFFFPLAPSPQKIELHYRQNADANVLVLNVSAALEGLHLPAQEKANE